MGRNRFFRRPHDCEECDDEFSIFNTWSEYLCLAICSIVFLILGTLATYYWILMYRSIYKAIPHNKANPCYGIHMHAVLNTIGLYCLGGFGVLTYRVGCFCNYFTSTLLHILCFVSGLVIFFISLSWAAEFREEAYKQRGIKTKDEELIPFYGAHSLCGILTAVLFIVVLILGFVLILYRSTRRYLLSMHQIGGIVCFGGITLSVITGYHQLMMIPSESRYLPFTDENYYVNGTLVFIVIAGISIILLLSRKELHRMKSMIVADQTE